jgi:hypothetical protein
MFFCWVQNACVICVIILGQWGGGPMETFEINGSGLFKFDLWQNCLHHQNHIVNILHIRKCSDFFFSEYIPLFYWTGRKQRVSGFGTKQQYTFLFK